MCQYANMFTETIIEWYKENKRDLPWRDSSDPYLIWISEVILQQTRVVQGYDYFLRFIGRFPDVSTLADAEEDEVMKYWQGLGYYSRARNLHAAAKSMNGVFPKTYPEVLALKGVGEYTAAAICSFAYNMPYAVVDGNVYRVLSRYFGIETPIDSTAGKKMCIRDRSICIIINEEMSEVRCFLEQQQRQLPIPLNVIVKSTPDSFHSFYELMPYLQGEGKFCLTTVDPIFREAEFADYIRTFRADESADALMAVTDYIDDERPLYVKTADNLRITGYASEMCIRDSVLH